MSLLRSYRLSLSASCAVLTPFSPRQSLEQSLLLLSAPDISVLLDQHSPYLSVKLAYASSSNHPILLFRN